MSSFLRPRLAKEYPTNLRYYDPLSPWITSLSQDLVQCTNTRLRSSTSRRLLFSFKTFTDNEHHDTKNYVLRETIAVTAKKLQRQSNLTLIRRFKYIHWWFFLNIPLNCLLTMGSRKTLLYCWILRIVFQTLTHISHRVWVEYYANRRSTNLNLIILKWLRERPFY